MHRENLHYYYSKLSLYLYKKKKENKKHDNTFTPERWQKHVIKCMSLVAGFGSYHERIECVKAANAKRLQPSS